MLEIDIDRITAEVKKHQENPETRHLAGKELVKKTLQTMQADPVGELIDFSDQFKAAPEKDKLVF